MGVAGVECSAEVNHQIELAQCFRGMRRVGIRTVEIAAQAQAEFQLPLASGCHGREGVEARSRRERNLEMRLQALENGVLESGCHAYGVDALDVGVASDWHQSTSGLADHTAHQSEIGDGLHILNA